MDAGHCVHTEIPKRPNLIFSDFSVPPKGVNVSIRSGLGRERFYRAIFLPHNCPSTLPSFDATISLLRLFQTHTQGMRRCAHVLRDALCTLQAPCLHTTSAAHLSYSTPPFSRVIPLPPRFAVTVVIMTNEISGNTRQWNLISGYEGHVPRVSGLTTHTHSKLQYLAERTSPVSLSPHTPTRHLFSG